MPELVPTGTGVLVPPDDAPALARAIAALEQDPARAARLGAAAARVQLRDGGWEGIARRFVAIYSAPRADRQR